MIYFFHPVQVFSTYKTSKARALQQLAQRFERVLVNGEDAPTHISCALQAAVAEIDAKYPHSRKTYIDYHLSDDGCGQIVAVRVSDTQAKLKPYFRIEFNRATKLATMREALALTEGGAK